MLFVKGSLNPYRGKKAKGGLQARRKGGGGGVVREREESFLRQLEDTLSEKPVYL